MKYRASVWKAQPIVSLVFGRPFYRYERQLVQVREVTFRGGPRVRRWKLLEHRLGGEDGLEVFRIDLVEGLTIGEAVEINSCGDDLAEIHERLFQVIELVPHGLAELCGCRSAIDAAVWSGDKSTFRGTVQRLASEDAGAGSRTWRHVFGTDGMTKAKVAHGYSGVLDLSIVRQSGDFDGGSRRGVTTFKSASLIFVHQPHGHFLGQIGMHECHMADFQTTRIQNRLESS